MASGVEWQRSCQKPNQVVHVPHAAAKSNGNKTRAKVAVTVVVPHVVVVVVAFGLPICWRCLSFVVFVFLAV